jgi:hypothetical protein
VERVADRQDIRPAERLVFDPETLEMAAALHRSVDIAETTKPGTGV